MLSLIFEEGKARKGAFSLLDGAGAVQWRSQSSKRLLQVKRVSSGIVFFSSCGGHYLGGFLFLK